MFYYKSQGIYKEEEYVAYLNGKRVKEVNSRFQKCFKDLFEDTDEDDIISAWKNDIPQKTDFFVKINKEIKKVSLKTGAKNSVHVIAISKFTRFLNENGVPQRQIIEYLKYHFADGTLNGSGQVRQSVKEYKEIHQEKIDELNRYLNEKILVINAIERFVTRGDNDSSKIDLLIYGEIDSFLYIKTDEIEELLLSKINHYSSGVHISVLSCQPMTRCLNRNPKYEKNRFSVQFKWFNLFDDIIEYRDKKSE